jgi:predicted nucleotidyltransferase component of viral defense system
MKKIPKERQIAINDAMDLCQVERDHVETLVEQFNAVLAEWREKFTEAVENYNDKLGDFRDIYTELAEQGRDYQSERSEKWADGETGQAYSEWLDRLENIDAEDIAIEFPDDLDMPDFSDWQDDGWLPPPAPGEG